MHDHLVATLHAWGNCQLIMSLPGGHRNEVFLVQRGNALLVAKRSRRSSAAIAWFADVQARAREAGFVVPCFVPGETGEPLIKGVTVETWTDGEGPERIRVQRALPVWEVAVSWQAGPDYARRLAGELLFGQAHGWN